MLTHGFCVYMLAHVRFTYVKGKTASKVHACTFTLFEMSDGPQTNFICLYKQISGSPACLVSAGLDVCQSVCLFGLWKASPFCCRESCQRQPSPSRLLPVSSETTFQLRRSGHVIDRGLALEIFPQTSPSPFDLILLSI